MNNIVEDVSILTTIPKKSLDRIIEKSHSCICHSVYENLCEHELLTELNIGIGTLYIKLENENVLYKFVPCKKLDESVKETFRNKKSPLVKKVEDALSTRIVHTYKDMM